MSDSELIVTIGAKDNTSTVIRKVNNELKYLDKEYELARKSSKNFENSQEGIKKKLETLSSKYDVNKIKLDAYKKKLTEVQENLTKEKEKLEQLKNAEGDNAKAIEKTEANIAKYNTQLHNAQNSIKLTESEMRNLKTEINETNTSLANFKINQFKDTMEQVGKNVQSAGEKIKNFGSGLSSAGTGLMKLSSPINALSLYSAKTAISFEQSMADLQATSGATGENFEALRNRAKELGRDTCKSATDSAAAMKYLALAGYDNKQILEATEPILKASVAWGADMATSADLATDSMSALGLTTDQLSHYLDVCSQAQRSSNTSATQMMEAYIGCGGTLRALNVPLEESATVLGRMADQGKKGSEAGNSLNSVLVNLTGGSSKAKGAMDALGVSAWDSKGNFIGLTNTLKLLKERLANCTQEQRTNFESAIGGKTQLDTLNMLLNGLGSQYDTLSGKINNCSGVTEDMYDIMNNTAEGNIQKLKSKLEGLGIQLGEKLVPRVNDLIDKLSDLVDWFSNLDEGTQQTILKMGLITFATGGVIKGLGSLTQSIGSIVSVTGKGIEKFSKLIKVTEEVETASNVASAEGVAKLGVSFGTLGFTALGVVAALTAVAGIIAVTKAQAELNNSTILDTKENMGTLELAVAKLTGTTVYSNEELENMGIKYKSFSEDIAPETKSNIEGIAEKFRGLQLEIDKLDISGAITDEDKNNLINKTNDLCNSILSSLEGMQSEAYNKIKDTFMIDGVIDEEEQKILSSMDSGANEIKDKVKRLSDDIRQLEENGASETVEGRAAIKSKILQLEDIYAEELKAKEKANQQDIQAFKNEAEKLDLDNAQKILQEKIKIRDEEVNATKSKYDESIQLLNEHLKQCEGAEAEATKGKIEKLEQQRDKELEIENNKYDGYLNVISEKYPEIANQINIYNGELLTNQDKSCQEVLERLKGTYEGINEITESGTYTLKDKYTNTWDTISVKTDESTGTIIGIYDNYNNSIGGYTKEICDSMKEQGQQANITSGDVANSFGIMSGATVNASGEIVGANGNIIGSLDNVKNHSDGTRSGIINLNGTPIRINCDKDGAINGMDQVIDKANAIPKKKTMTISAVFEAIGNGVKSLFGFANGTDNAPSGVAFVAEEGQELILDGRRALLTGNSGPQLYNFKGGEKVITAPETKKLLSKQINGGFFNQNSSLSKQLINNTTNNYNTSSSNDINMNILAQMIAEATATAVSNAMSNVTLKSNVYFNENALADSVGGKLAATRRRIR